MATLFPISVFSSLFLLSSVHSASFTFTNNCAYTVWPGVLPNAGTAALSTTGFELKQGESTTLSAPGAWSGRFFARTLCSTDSTGRFSCVTSDCGSGTVECSGGGAAPPATLAEFTLGNGAMDFYDVSLVDGFNLPMMVSPRGGSGNCTATGCLVDLNGLCPSALRLTTTSSSSSVACKSACEAFRDPQYCCSGSYGNPNTCKPTAYSQFFKNACPRSYSTFTCSGADYVITLCPSIHSQKSSSGQYPVAAGLPLINNTIIISGVSDSDAMSGAETRWSHGRGLLWLALATIVSMLVIMNLLTLIRRWWLVVGGSNLNSTNFLTQTNCGVEGEVDSISIDATVLEEGRELTQLIHEATSHVSVGI